MHLTISHNCNTTMAARPQNDETALFLNRIKGYMATHHMPQQGCKVLVALSGGADSVALLHVLLQLGYECVAAHCNFHLRGDESMRDERFTRTLCQQLGTRLEVRHFDVPARMATDGSSLEMACRDLRYEWFEDLRRNENCKAIAVAHHRDDNIETLLLNLLRGTGITGVAGIKPVNGHIVRPMLCVSRNEIESYLAAIGQSFIVDSTNTQNDAYRNRLRNIILPTIRQYFPTADAGLARSLRDLLSCNELYESLLSRRIAEIVTTSNDCTIIDIKAINNEPGATALLFAAMRQYGFNSTQVTEIFESFNSDRAVGKHFYAGTHRADIDRDKIIIAPIVGQEYITIDMCAPDENNPIGLKISEIDLSNFNIARVCDGRHKVCFGRDIAHCKHLIARHWQDGDRFKPFGMHGRSRLVSDLFTDLKLSEAEKRRAWLLEADGEVVWVMGYRSSEAFRVAPGNGIAYLFSIE